MECIGHISVSVASDRRENRSLHTSEMETVSQEGTGIWWDTWQLEPHLWLIGTAPDPLMAMAVVLADLCEDSHELSQ